LNVIVETPKGSQNKYEFDDKLRCFKLTKILPAGATFPFNFGCLPQTKGGDGDPLDVLVLMDDQAFPGCLVQARLLGVIEAHQQEGKKMVQNDRLVAVAAEDTKYQTVKRPEDLGPDVLKEYEHFFASYHAIRGNQFHVVGVRGPKRAMQIVKKARNEFKRK